MFVAVSTRTMAGAARIAAERVEAIPPAITAPELEPAPEAAPEPNKVVRLSIPRSPAQQIIHDIASQHGLSYADLVGKSRSRKVVEARFDAVAAVKTARPMITLNQLGRLFRRDHTSALAALRKRGLA